MEKRRSELTLLRTFLVLALFLLCGCMQVKESLTIDRNGSGALEADLMVPKATTDFIDQTFGGMMQGMAQMAKQMGADASELKVSSASEKMFADKEEIKKKADAVGLNISFTHFEKEVKEDGLYVSYKLEYDDINKLLRSGLVGTKFSLSKDTDGDFICSMESDEEKAAESKMQLEQVKAPEKSEQVTEEEKKAQEALMNAMRNFKMEFVITMPNEITEVSGVFSKMDSKTARVVFSGDLLASPELIDKMYGVDQEVSKVVCSAQGIEFEIVEFAEELEELPEGSWKESAPPVYEEKKAKIFLNDGRVIEGDIVEETQSLIKVKVSSSIVFTFPRQDIARIE